MDEPPEQREPRAEDAPHPVSGQDARGGEIILRSRRRRVIFIAGLVGIALLALILRLAV